MLSARCTLTGFQAAMVSRAMSTSVCDSAKVGFIGLGNMGNGMAQNLMTKGHSVTVFDVDSSAMDGLVAKGAQKASSPKEVAAASEQVVTMLPNNDIVRNVYAGANGVLQGVQKGALLIDSSTIDPAVSKEMAEKCAAAGADFVDAPVSGGVNAANAGTLTFMVGAKSEPIFEAAKALLDLMGGKVVHCGAVGTGQSVKICNNMLLAISMIGVSETMNLGVRLGLDAKLLSDILASATGRCWSVDTYNPVPGIMPNVPSSNDYKGGFGTALMNKDLGLAQDAAKRSNTATPLGSLATEIYNEMTESGYAQKDFSSAYKWLQEKSK